MSIQCKSEIKHLTGFRLKLQLSTFGDTDYSAVQDLGNKMYIK